ncbi:MAG: right-handed parallel beta-helix repeat-containing protein, partial [Paludibacteraceae bacterium]|nr:right-handed parallel beta-helix repeat-containing protein [Paludibacteraceae bacterium]
ILDSVISCWISGNDSVGMYGSRIIYGNNIGLDRNQKTAMPNGYGIIASPYTDVIKNNIVAGNNRCGVLASEKNSLDSINENFIGTNRNLDIDPILGNGEDGLRGPGGALSHMPSISNCYFMNNHGSGINAMLEGTVSSCVFSNNSENGAIFTDFIGLPRFKQCSFSDNKQGGLVLLGQSDIIDIDSCEFSRNENYGLSISQCNFDLTNSTFDSNKGTAFVYDITKYDATTSLLSDNKFLHTNKAYPAFKTTDPYPVPEFISCKMTEKTIVIEGKIDTAAKAKIELFYTSQGEQTAEMLVDSFYTNADGTFSDTLDRSMFVGKSIIGFTATATYGKITSPLSDVVYPELGKVDLTRTEFYVKIDGYGDGSTWEKAMSPQTFAYYLPQAKDGSTFHVAEGTYYPMYDYTLKMPTTDKRSATFFIQSNITIKGGYSATAKSGDVADPDMYISIFSGDKDKNDKVTISEIEEHKKILDFENYDDNLNVVFSVFQSENDAAIDKGSDNPASTIKDNGKKEKYLKINGVCIEGGITGMRCANPRIQVTLENTTLKNISGRSFYLNHSPAKFVVSHSKFNRCGGFEIIDYDTIYFSDVKISECGNFDIIAQNKSTRISFDELEYVENYGEFELSLCQSIVSITNSKFERNECSGSDCIIINNTLGGIDKGGDVFVDNCTFGNNVASYSFRVINGYAKLQNCNFIENDNRFNTLEVTGRFEDKVNGRYGNKDLNLYMENCLFDSNKADYLISAPYYGSSDIIRSCVFKNNRVNHTMLTHYYGHMSLDRSVIENNEISDNIINALNLEISNTVFTNNEVEDAAIYTDTLSVYKSKFNENKSDVALIHSNELINIDGSTFADNKAHNVLSLSHCDFSSVNSTYVNNITDEALIFGIYINCELYNNTILSNDIKDDNFRSVYLGGGGDLKMKGNIIENIYLTGTYDSSVVSQNNVFICDLSARVSGSVSVWANEENAISLNVSDCSKLFDGEYDSKNDKFEASLKDNGGFTPTIALK